MTSTHCPLPLVALRGDETCPRCGRPAREHRRHPSYQETTMTETTEPTREQIEASGGVCEKCGAREVPCTGPRTAYACGSYDYDRRSGTFVQGANCSDRVETEPTREKIAQWLAQAEANDWGPEMSTDDQCAVLRLALRTLDAEAQLDHARRRIDAFTARDNAADETIAVLAKENAALTDRAEEAEAQLAAMTDYLPCEHSRDDEACGVCVACLRVGMESALRSRAAMTERAEKAERERDGHAQVAHTMACGWDAATQRATSAVQERDTLRTKLADAERRIAELSPTTTDARLDYESSSLLLLSTWARKVMMRPKNRSKGVPSESIWALLRMACEELFEASDAIEEDAHVSDILAELGDAAAFIAFAMREVESRRPR